MKTKRRTEITFETHEVTVIRVRRSPRIYCETCRRVVPHLGLESVRGLFSDGQLSRASAAGEIHSTSGEDGRPLLCSDSLAAFAEDKKE